MSQITLNRDDAVLLVVRHGEGFAVINRNAVKMMAEAQASGADVAQFMNNRMLPDGEVLDLAEWERDIRKDAIEALLKLINRRLDSFDGVWMWSEIRFLRRSGASRKEVADALHITLSSVRRVEKLMRRSAVWDEPIGPEIRIGL